MLMFSMALIAWTEKLAQRKKFYALAAAWIVGKAAEGLLGVQGPWHWDIARLAVIAVFWHWAWPQARRRVVPLVLTLAVMAGEDLFLVNEPGIVGEDAVMFILAAFAVAYLTAQSYWGMAAAVAGAAMLNQGLVVFFYRGISDYVDLPDRLLWHFGVAILAVAGIWRVCLPWLNFAAAKRWWRPGARPQTEEGVDLEADQ